MADGAGGIEIRHLYRIFGTRGPSFVDAVKNGMTKAELNATSAHVLGLRDINIRMEGGASRSSWAFRASASRR